MNDDLKISFDEATGTVTVKGDGDFTYKHENEFPRKQKVFEIVFDGNIYIDSFLFLDKYENLEKIVFPQGMKIIKDMRHCKSLKEVVLPDSIEIIECFAFEGCKKLLEVNLAPHIIVEDNAFDPESPIAKHIEQSKKEERLQRIGLSATEFREFLKSKTLEDLIKIYKPISEIVRREAGQKGDFDQIIRFGDVNDSSADKNELIEKIIFGVKEYDEARPFVVKLLKASHNNFEVSVGPKTLADIIYDDESMRLAIESMSGIDWEVLEKLKSSDQQETLAKLNKEKKQCDDELAKIDEKFNEIKSTIKQSESILNSVQELLKTINQTKSAWQNSAATLFRKACLANVRIVFHPDGYSIRKTSDGHGVCTSPETNGNYTTDENISSDILNDLKERCATSLPLWKAYFDANRAFWNYFVGSNTIDGIESENISPSELISKLKKKFDCIAEKEGELRQKRNSLLNKQDEINSRIAEVKEAQREREAQFSETKRKLDNLNKVMALNDPVLAGFAIPEEIGSTIYDNEWISLVKKSAQTRKSRKFLPLTPWIGSQGIVYSWIEAIKSNKPNFIIDSFHNETELERRDMLDVFVATMLLSFPIKKVHFNVIERHAVNPFVANLPEKICKVYDIKRDTAAIKDLVWRLKEMTREGREKQIRPCLPREIVVLAGYDRNDKEFNALMDDLRDVIIDGYSAGIYFALLLTDDYEDYKEGEKIEVNFVQYFERYSTILTNQLADDGYIPDYDILRRKAKIQDADGNIKECTLSDLIANYVAKEANITPSGVYSGIETGALYASNPIKDLTDQPASDVDSIVVPIAQTQDGEVINLRMNSTDYISYFILGRSGMGKSYTLHTILTNLMLKYDSSIIDLILMDFKPGGVEMNYYKDVPHVSKLLVNGADRQVAKEILLSILKEMDCRGEVFQQCDVSSIRKYNNYARNNGLEQMKHIILMVDECQDLFKIDNPGSDVNIVTEIARKGRSYGIHMILATQTLQGTDIPGDALAQFSDFLFMGCKDSDVDKCEIKDHDVVKTVNKLTKGEVIYCHRSSNPVHGYVFNYSGKNGTYREKTHECLLSTKYTPAQSPQFYFNASQIYQLDENDLNQLVETAFSGIKPVPIAILGKNLSVNSETLYTKFRKSEGGNLLVMGINEMLQAERVLWNAMLSLRHSHKATETSARFYILQTFPEEVNGEAFEYNKIQVNLLRNMANMPNVEIVDENDRSTIIERIAATVRHRHLIADSNRKAIDSLDSIYLILPNQHLYYTKMAKATRGEKSLDEGHDESLAQSVNSLIDIPPIANESTIDAFGFEELDFGNNESKPKKVSTDSLGFEFIDFGAFEQREEPEQKTNGGIVVKSPFITIDCGESATPRQEPQPVSSIPGLDYNSGRGRNLGQELHQILQNGPEVKIHVLLQTTSPEKVFSDEPLRRSEMSLFFNDMVFTRMAQTNGLPIPDTRDCAQIEKLSANPKSLRAIVYNAERGIRTIVPFDFPDIELFK